MAPPVGVVMMNFARTGDMFEVPINDRLVVAAAVEGVAAVSRVLLAWGIPTATSEGPTATTYVAVDVTADFDIGLLLLLLLLLLITRLPTSAETVGTDAVLAAELAAELEAELAAVLAAPTTDGNVMQSNVAPGLAPDTTVRPPSLQLLSGRAMNVPERGRECRCCLLSTTITLPAPASGKADCGCCCCCVKSDARFEGPAFVMVEVAVAAATVTAAAADVAAALMRAAVAAMVVGAGLTATTLASSR